MPPLSDKELEERLHTAGNSLLQPPSSLDELQPLLDRIEELLSKVEQSPAKSMQNALSPLMKALVAEELLKHSDVDVKVGVASCISEITRITAPDAPYDDDKMKDVFHLIVSSFENLSDASSRSHEKRASILETVAKVRSCVIMLDLECDQMIIEMFQHFLNSIRAYHTEVIFASMETIMTLVLEESEDISPDLLNPILATLKRNNEVVQPIAKKLAERVIQNCAEKLKPYLTLAIKTLDTSLDDYSAVVASTCEANTGAVGHNNENIGKDLMVAGDVSIKTSTRGKDSSVNRSPEAIESNGINQTVTEETMTDANYSNKAHSNQKFDSKSASKSASHDLCAQKPAKMEAKFDHAAKRKGRELNTKNYSAESSEDLIDDEKQAEQIPCYQEIPDKDGSPGEVLPVEAGKSLDDVKETSAHVSQSKAPENEAVNLASPTQSASIPDESQSKKAGRAKRKENLGGEETPTAEHASKKESEEAKISEAKKQRRSGKTDKTVNKDKALTKEGSSKNDGVSTSDSEARSIDQIEKSGAGNKTEHTSLSGKESGKKRGRTKPNLLKLSATEDHGKDTVASPRSPLNSTKDETNLEETPRMSGKRKRSPVTETNLEETPRMSGKRKRSPVTDKVSETKEYGENLVGSKVKVWWPKDRMFYEGVVTCFDSVKKKHTVLYTDGDKEVLNFRRERWEFVGDDTVSDEGKAVDHSIHDSSSDVPRKKKGSTNSETSSKRRKLEGSPKSEPKSSSKLKDIATKSGGKSGGKFKDDLKADARSNSKAGGKSEDDTVKHKDNSQKPRGKSHDDSAKASGDVAKTPSHSKQDNPRIAKSKGKTPPSGKVTSANGTGLPKSSSSKVKETDQVKEKTNELAKSQETVKGKSSDTAKFRESETKSGKKRRR